MTSADDLDPDDVLGSLLRGQGAGSSAGRGPADADPHAGHDHADPLRPSADLSVRPAVPEDAPALGDLHARTLRASLAAGTGADLAPAVAGAIDPAELGQSWGTAITAAPSPRHRVLTALAGAQIVGFAAIAPVEVPVEVRPAEDDGTGRSAPPGGSGPADEEPDAGGVAEILALEVPAAFGRRGHGSRLLAACVDLLREQGVRRVQTWTVQGDESRTRFLSDAGFAPAGLRRTLDVGGHELVEICWYAEL